MVVLLDSALSAVRQALHERAEYDTPPLASDSRAPTLYGVMGSFGLLALIAVVLRFHTKIRFAKLRWDDVAIAIGLILYAGLIAATGFRIRYGLGAHIWYADPETFQQMLKVSFASRVLYSPCRGVIALSIILFLVRVLPPNHGRKTLYGIAAWVVASETAFTVATCLQCRPLNFFWDATVEGTCFGWTMFSYAGASLNMATDVAILLSPWFVIRGLNLSKRGKYELLAICSVGVFTLFSSIVRLPLLHDLNKSHDTTYDSVGLDVWYLAELGSAIMLASVPAIRPLVAHYFPNFMGSLDGKSIGATGDSSPGPVSGEHVHELPPRSMPQPPTELPPQQPQGHYYHQGHYHPQESYPHPQHAHELPPRFMSPPPAELPPDMQQAQAYYYPQHAYELPIPSPQPRMVEMGGGTQGPR